MIRNVGDESPSSPQVSDGTGQTEGPGGQAVPMIVFVVLDVLLSVSDLYRLSGSLRWSIRSGCSCSRSYTTEASNGGCTLYVS